MCKTCDAYRNTCDLLTADLVRAGRQRDEALAALAAVARAAQEASRGASAVEALGAGCVAAIMETTSSS